MEYSRKQKDFAKDVPEFLELNAPRNLGAVFPNPLQFLPLFLKSTNL